MSPLRSPPQKPIIIIPSRMGSERLPGKPLADIHGLPMISHVVKRALESGVGPVVVACDDQRIVAAAAAAGARAVLTRADHPSGSDRIWEALSRLDDHQSYDAIINVQGDEPALDPKLITAAWRLLKNVVIDIATLAAPLNDDVKKNAPQVVKVAIDMAPSALQGRALYFSRLPVPSGEGPFYHHIGLYAYRRDALEAFVQTAPSALERREKLEQLRALSLGLHIEVAIADTMPHGVDTPDDLDAVRRSMEPV